MKTVRDDYYKQNDQDRTISLDPVSDMRYKYVMSNDCFGNGLSSLAGLTFTRIGYVEGDLEEIIVTEEEVVYNFDNENYLKPLPSSIVVLNNNYKNTDIVKHGNVSIINGYIYKTDIKNKSSLLDKELYENLGVSVPTLIKTHNKGNDIVIPEYKFSSDNSYLDKFRLSYNRPYSPMYFGYRENGYVNNYTMDFSKNVKFDINYFESVFRYSHDWLSMITDEVFEVGSSGVYYSDRSAVKHVSNVHYKLSLLTTRNHKRNNFMLADRNRTTTLSNDIIEFVNMSSSYSDGENKQNPLSDSKNFINLTNKTEECDCASFLKFNESPCSFRVSPLSYFKVFNANDKKFLNSLMMDIGPSLDVREYLYIRDASGCGYIDKDIDRLGISFLNHHGAINVKALNKNFFSFQDKFFPRDDSLSTNLNYSDADSWNESMSILDSDDDITIDRKQGELLPIVDDSLNHDLKSWYHFANLDELVCSTNNLYPYTAIPVFSMVGKYGSKVVNEYRYEGTFNNSLPIVNSPVNNTFNFSLYYNQTFRGGIGCSVVTRDYSSSLVNVYDGINYLNTFSDSYSSLGNGTNYMVQRLKSRLSLSLVINASYSKFSVFKDLIKYCSKLARSSSKEITNRTYMDPLDLQNYIYSSELSIESGYADDNLYLPTERFNNVFVGYDSEITYIKQEDVKIDIATKPTTLRFLLVTDNDSRYLLPHRITGRSVLQFRNYQTTNKSISGYVTNPVAIAKSYSENNDESVPLVQVRVENGIVGFDTKCGTKFDNIVQGWYCNGNRVLETNGSISINDCFKNSRYESITSTSLMEKSIISHDEILESMKASFIDMDSVKGSNPITRDIVNLCNFKAIYNTHNGCNNGELALDDYHEFEDAYNDISSLYNIVKPSLDSVRTITNNYIK